MEAPRLQDPQRQLWIVPIRHHSPACAAHLQRLLDAIQPRAVLVEGPCDFDPLISQICDSRTRAPVAIVALREASASSATKRVASYFPFCAHSPELIALQAAAARNVRAHFIDLPSSSSVMQGDLEADADRSLLGHEAPFDVGDYVTALARELGCRDGNEVWDQLFESRIAQPDWTSFFADVGQYCACIRGASQQTDMERDGTLAREAQMRALIAAYRQEIQGPIVVVVGGFHAPVLLEASDTKPSKPVTKAGRSYLIRYGMRQLDALAGYQAGLALPGFYHRLWQARESGGKDLALDLITGFAAHLRDQGVGPTLPVVANAVEQAQRLAALRNRPFPARDDIIDAVRSSFIKDEIPLEQAPLLVTLRCWLTGTTIGDVPPSAGSPPLVETVRARARALGFSVLDGERRTREFDIYRKPRHRDASRFCHAMTLIGTDFAHRTAGPDFRNDASLDRLFEVWSVCWSPTLESRLIELSEVADTLDEALAWSLTEKLRNLAELGKGRSALAAIDLYVAACRAGLGEAAQGVLDYVERQILEDPELGSVTAALTDLVLLWRASKALDGVAVATLTRIIEATWRRVLVLLPELGQCGDEQIRQAIATLADLRGLIELAQSSAAPLDRALFNDALSQLATGDLDPMLAGAVMAFSLIDGVVTSEQMEARLRGELVSGYVKASDRLAFLGGIIAIARELLWSLPSLVDALNDLLASASEADFVDLLPHLRLALMPLDPRETDRLADVVANRLGVNSRGLSSLVAISETQLLENLKLDRELDAILMRDFAR